jgi:hypothetical protein
MDPRLIARVNALGRAAIGVFAIAAPERMLEPWIGSDAGRTTNKVLGRALGARDLVIAAGALRSIDDTDALRPWLAAAVLADCVDFGATAAGGSDLPLRGRAFVMALAGGAAAMGAVALASLDAEA